jgi:hypothetical protein
VAPVLWNVAQIGAAVVVGLSAAHHNDTHALAVALAWGVLIGGALQLGIQLVPVHGLLGSFRFSLDVGRASVKAVLRRFAPVVLGRGVVQIMGYVDLTLASFLAAGSVSAFNFSQVLYILPISVFAMSVAAAQLPDLSSVEVHDADTRRAFRRRLEEGMARIMYYVAPTATIFIVAGDVVVRLAYQRGRLRTRRHLGGVAGAGGVLVRAARRHLVAAAPERPLRPRRHQDPRPAGRHPGADRRRARARLHVPVRPAHDHGGRHPGLEPHDRLRTAARRRAQRRAHAPPRHRGPRHRGVDRRLGRVPGAVTLAGLADRADPARPAAGSTRSPPAAPPPPWWRGR